MAEVILHCPEHPRWTCCIVNFDGAHVPGRACQCLVLDGQLVPDQECPIDEHRVRWIQRHGDW